MTDMEIFKLLYDIKPENEQQKNKIKKMMSIILRDVYYNPSVDVVNFLDTITEDEVINTPTKDVYLKYEYWCKRQGITPVGKNAFGGAVQNRFNVISKVVKVNGKCLRAFKNI